MIRLPRPLLSALFLLVVASLASAQGQYDPFDAATVVHRDADPPFTGFMRIANTPQPSLFCDDTYVDDDWRIRRWQVRRAIYDSYGFRTTVTELQSYGGPDTGSTDEQYYSLGDLDGDGWDDIAFGFDSDVYTYWSRGLAQFTFVDGPVLGLVDPIQGMVAADFTQDSVLDLAVLVPGELRIFVNDGAGGFPASPRPAAGP